ncbi:MAG: phosphoethanolamine--lipid A transferase [Betaproteobacteria bacterium]|nr:phosphoethanolamine--lipid A transferase [Betaproteobacteria bacterium]
MSRQTLTLLASLWLVALGNFPFWRSIWQATGGLRTDNVFFLLTAPLFVLAWVYLTLSLLTWGRATKAALATVLLTSAAAGYFIDTYGILLDHGMIANIVQTHTAEALELLSWRLWVWLLVFGVLPALLIARVRVVGRPWTRELSAKALGMAAAVACLAAMLLVHYQHYASLLRNHRELRLMLVPSNIVAAVHGHLTRSLAAPVTLEVVGADATRAFSGARAAKPTLTILVVGETARAANFSLNGYPRPTNPELARQNVFSFSDVSACGTSTAVSLPCMFLDVGRDGFQATLALRHEGLLDVLQHAGIAVRWRDNNSGCKGVCDRVPHEDLSIMQVPGLCRSDECYDEILLHGLQDYLDKQDRDTLIVLHMKGSHGPAYFKRYPPAFEAFTPACDNVQLDRCSRQEIVNAYDNTLRYTDYVLSRTIDLLRSNARRFDTAMLYVSDHGESLGENGLYLHGLPYALAPREQIQVPLLLWLSEDLRERLGIDAACLRTRQHAPLSHDYVYHSILGLSNVQTAIYRAEHDLFRPCRPTVTALNSQ